MEVIRHESILEALSNRANRFRNLGKTTSVDNNQVSSALDETGTIDASLLQNFRENEELRTQTELTERIRVSEATVSDEVLKIHGIAPMSKGEGVTRLIYENANGICNKLCNNEKVERAKELHDSLEADIVAYNEHRLNGSQTQCQRV